MAVERAAAGSSLIDVLDRVLDKGIVIDAWVRVSLVGIDLLSVEARVVVVLDPLHAARGEIGRRAAALGVAQNFPADFGDLEGDARMLAASLLVY